jgi:hypothetical protein
MHGSRTAMQFGFHPVRAGGRAISLDRGDVRGCDMAAQARCRRMEAWSRTVGAGDGGVQGCWS